MKIIVRIEKVYGVDRIYPVCTDAKLFCVLVGNKTLNQGQIDLIKALGFTVEVQTPSL